MRVVRKNVSFWIGLALLGCARRENPAPSPPNSAEPAHSAAFASKTPGPSPAPGPAPVHEPATPPRKVVKADGFALIEHADGQVRIETIDLWNQKLETTYADCDYFEKAVPVLERQLTPERGAKLKQVCFHKKH